MEITREQLLDVMPTAKNRVDLYLANLNYFGKGFCINTPQRWAHYLAQIAHESCELKYTKELASGKAYEGRKDLGNTKNGDGMRYKGRGLIQITGKANYEKYKAFCGYDVVLHPELLEKPFGAVKSSMWYWLKHDLNTLADKDDLKGITKVINGGLNGYEDRKKYLIRAKKTLKIL